MEIYLVACQDFEPTSLQVPWWPGIEFERQYLTLGEPGIRKLDLGTWVIQMIDKKKVATIKNAINPINLHFFGKNCNIGYVNKNIIRICPRSTQ